MSEIVFRTQSDRIRVYRQTKDLVTGKPRREALGAIMTGGGKNVLRLTAELSLAERRTVDERVARLDEQRLEIDRGTAAALPADMAAVADMVRGAAVTDRHAIADLQEAAQGLVSACRKARKVGEKPGSAARGGFQLAMSKAG